MTSDQLIPQIVPEALSRLERRQRDAALEEAARRVEDFRMPKHLRDSGRPVMLLEVTAEIAKAIRAMKR